MTWFNTDWNYKIQISTVAQYMSSSQTNIPILVSMSSVAGLADYAKSDASDVLFVDSTETTVLPHEIIQFDKKSNGVGGIVAWVKWNSITISTTSSAWMYFGNSIATGSYENTASLWTSYRLVSHFSHYGERSLKDSSTAKLSGSIMGVPGTQSVTPISGALSKIVGGYSFDPKLTTPLAASGTIMYTASINETTFTMTFWAKAAANQTASSNIYKLITMAAPVGVQGQWYWYPTSSNSGSNDIAQMFGVGSTNVEVTASWRWSPPTTITRGDWHYWAIQMNGVVSDARLYVDGIYFGSTNMNRADGVAKSIDIGSGNRGLAEWTGSIESFRYTSASLPLARIQLEYWNQVNPNNFFTFGNVTKNPYRQTSLNTDVQIGNYGYSFGGGLSRAYLRISGSSDMIISGGNTAVITSPSVSTTLVGMESPNWYVVDQKIVANAIVTGSVYKNVRKVYAQGAAIAPSDYFVLVYATASATSALYLPHVTSASLGKRYVIKDANGLGARFILVSSSLFNRIDGIGGYVFLTASQAASFVSDGSNWFTI